MKNAEFVRHDNTARQLKLDLRALHADVASKLADNQSLRYSSPIMAITRVITPGKPRPFRLEEVREELTADQSSFLNKLWQHFLSAGEWPTTFETDRELRREHIRETIQPLSGDVVYESDDPSRGDRYELTLVGVLLTRNGSNYQVLLTRLIEFLRDKYAIPKEKTQFTDMEIEVALGLSDDEFLVLGKLAKLDYGLESFDQGNGRWGIRFCKLVIEAPRQGSLVARVEEFLVRNARRGTPVFKEDRRPFSPPSSYDLEQFFESPYGPSPGRWQPPEISESIKKFRKDHPDPKRVAFVMMRFGQTKAHSAILKAIQHEFNEHGIKALRADAKEYHDDTLPNILTYIYGCGLGVAVFERIEQEEFRPDVALEVGYMMAMRKPILLLKDKTLQALHADLIGKLYKPFDQEKIQKSISLHVGKWLKDRDLIPPS